VLDRLDDDLDVGQREVVALEQQRLAEIQRERIRETIAKVESRGMPTALAEPLIRGPGDLRLRRRQRLDDDARLLKVLVQCAGYHRVVQAVDHDAQLNVGASRDTDGGGCRDDS